MSYSWVMAFKPKKIRVKRVSRVALVDEGANFIPGLYKSKDGKLEMHVLTKSVGQGLLHCIVYAPMMVDSAGHFMDAQGVKDACHTFGVSGMEMDVMHKGEALKKSQAAPVESYIMKAHDSDFPEVDHLGRDIEHVGAWAMVAKVSDPSLHKFSELSLSCEAGDYELLDPTGEELALLKSAGPPSEDTDDNPMDSELTKALSDLSNAFKSGIEDLGETLKAEIKSLDKSKDEKPDDKPEELSAREQLKKARKGMSLTRLLKQYDLDSIEDAAELNDDDFKAFEEGLDAIENPARKRRSGPSRTGGDLQKSFGVSSDINPNEILKSCAEKNNYDNKRFNPLAS